MHLTFTVFRYEVSKISSDSNDLQASSVANDAARWHSVQHNTTHNFLHVCLLRRDTVRYYTKIANFFICYVNLLLTPTVAKICDTYVGWSAALLMIVCRHCKKKTARATYTKLGRHTVHGSCSAWIDPEVKKSKSRSEWPNALPVWLCTLITW